MDIRKDLCGVQLNGDWSWGWGRKIKEKDLPKVQMAL